MKYELYELKTVKQTGNKIEEVCKKHILDMPVDDELKFLGINFSDLLRNYTGDYLYIVGFEDNEPVEARGVLYKTDLGWTYDCAEWDDRVMISVAFNVDLV